MRIAFNALSVTNLSGRHVLLGHMREVIRHTPDGCRHLLLHHSSNRDLVRSLGDAVDAIECPAWTAHWAGRALYEHLVLPSVLKAQQAQLLFMPSGVTIPAVRLPQWVLAQNPWCLVPEAHRGLMAGLKAALQRRAYRRAQRDAALMLFNSDYMRRAYAENAGHEPKAWRLLHQGLDPATFAAAAVATTPEPRAPKILTVSVMAPHKGIEDVVAALALLRGRGVLARLTLVGPWPDAAYQKRIREQVAAAGLETSVDFVGYVTTEALHRHFAQARVFCLLSRCESFGIPAVEAQAFGTPSVVADCCAPPEIAGPGGLVVPAYDVGAAADALQQLLTDDEAWRERSAAARANAARFQWEMCSMLLMASAFSQAIPLAKQIVRQQ